MANWLNLRTKSTSLLLTVSATTLFTAKNAESWKTVSTSAVETESKVIFDEFSRLESPATGAATFVMISVSF